jgi:predicted ferric reductase
MKANLKEKNLIAKNTLKLIFSLKKKINFKAGQYAFITLTGHKIDEPRGNKHHFSIVDPSEGNIKIT